MLRIRERRGWVVYAVLGLVQLLFGLHYLAAKIVLLEIPPKIWALMRVSAAAVVLMIGCRALGRKIPNSPSVLGRLALYSLFGVVINQLCFVEGLARTTAGHASIIMTGIPVGTMLFAVVLGRERWSLRKALCIGVALTGVLLVIGPGFSDLTHSYWRGDLLILANALSYSLFLVISKDLLQRIDSLSATAWVFGFGSLLLAIPGLPSLVAFDLASVSTQSWALGVWIVLFPTAGAYLLTYWALARVESSMVALFIYLQPLIATSLSIAFFGERLSLAMVVGAALVFGGVYLAMRKAKVRPSRPRGEGQACQ